jgi:hypothetical protein
VRLAAALLVLALLGGCIQVNVPDADGGPSGSEAPRGTGSSSSASARPGQLRIDFTWSPEAPRTGDSVRFQASASNPGGRTVDSWTWDFGDNSTGRGPSVGHAYTKAGARDVVLRALSSDGTVLQAQHNLFVLAPGQAAPPPRAPGNSSTGPVDVPPPPPPGEFMCPAGPVTEPFDTFGRDDSLPGLSWAALKTGFRFAVAWSTESPTIETLRYTVGRDPERSLSDVAPTRVHLFVLDDLPTGQTICFTAGTAPLHAARLANAMTAFQEAEPHGVYTINVLVLANEGGDLTEIEPGMQRFAELLWDSTDGWVRAGAMMVVAGDYLHHNSGWALCYVGGVSSAVCNQVYDVIVTEDAVPQGAASTYRQGVKDPDAAMWMNQHFQAMPGPLSMDDFGAVLVHEAGHYFFDMDDLYGDPVVPDSQACDLPEHSMSIMGGGRDTTEFDDELRPCPTQGADYVPSWTLMRDQFDRIPDRDGPVLQGPSGTGGLAFQVTYRGV